MPMNHFIDPKLWDTYDRWKGTKPKGGPAYKQIDAIDLELFNACESGDIQGVLSALKSGANVNTQRGKNGVSPLQ